MMENDTLVRHDGKFIIQPQVKQIQIEKCLSWVGIELGTSLLAVACCIHTARLNVNEKKNVIFKFDNALFINDAVLEMVGGATWKMAAIPVLKSFSRTVN